jgi:glycosyltransferase involved in cell wall biosynthesis
MKISIIIPVYNVEHYLLECLQSVANQSMKDGIECILVDDCGTDRSVWIAKEFIKNYSGNIHFSLIHHTANAGLSAARNTGINAAKGDYVYFLDSDDTIVAHTMELMWSFIKKYGYVDLVQGSFFESEKELQTNSTYFHQEFISDRKAIKCFLLDYKGDIVPAQSRLVNRKFLLENKLFFKEGIIHEDNHWTFFLAKVTRTMCFCKERTYFHRYNPSSITGNVNIAKEAFAYKTLITDFCLNLDSFQRGTQKIFVLNNFLTANNNGYYKYENDKEEMLHSLYAVNNVIENFLFNIYLKVNKIFIKNKTLHLLIRMYRLLN